MKITRGFSGKMYDKLLFNDLKGRCEMKIVCANPNCAYQGKAIKKARGSLIVGLFLCCFLLLPGVLYFMFKSGYRYSCPKCGLQMAADN